MSEKDRRQCVYISGIFLYHLRNNCNCFSIENLNMLSA